MTCTATCGNGATTGGIQTTMIRRRLLILRGQLRAPTGCFVAAAGATTPGTAGRRTVAGTFRRTWAAASVSVLFAVRAGDVLSEGQPERIPAAI